MSDKTKTLKQLNDHVSSIEQNVNSVDAKFTLACANQNSLSQSISQSLQNIDMRFDNLNKTLVNLENQQASLSEKISVSTETIKKDIEEIKSVVISKLKEDNRILRSRVTYLEKRMLLNEKNRNQQDQHSRKIYVELSGIPASVKQDNLKPTLVTIFSNAGIDDVSTDDIEVTHRIFSRQDPKPVIIKARRDFIEKVFSMKKSILDAGKNENLKFGVNNKLYVNDHLSPAFKSLRYNCKLLKNEGHIDEFWISNAKLKLKINGNVKVIAHEYDLYEIAPDFEFTFDTDLYASLENNEMDLMDDLAGVR